MDRNPTKTAARESKRQRRLGRGAACALCGMGHQALLIVVEDQALAERINRVLLEQHHPYGRAHDPSLTVVLCRNCHALATDDQLRAAVPMTRQGSPLGRGIARLMSRASFDRTAAEAEDREAEELKEFVAFLDSECPEWRSRWKEKKR